jgi:hypothetical protein
MRISDADRAPCSAEEEPDEINPRRVGDFDSRFWLSPV